MKKTMMAAVLCVVFAAAGHAKGDVISEAFKEARRIEKQIRTTSFRSQDFNILDFGAVADRPDQPCHEAVNRAIVQCSLAGGGRVVVPAGTFYVGPITMKSNVNLYLAEGASLRFVENKDLYLPQVLTRWEGVDCYNYHPLIYAYGETNIAITGKGTIDGQASNTNWWNMNGSTRYGWTPGQVSQSQGGRSKLLAFGENKTPVSERIMGPQDALRAQLIHFNSCNTVLIEGVQLRNSPFWVIHPLLCENLIVRGVRIECHDPNGDGCDPESCRNVLIENCYFDTGDDCIAIKSGRNNDGRRWNVPSENIIVRNCEMKDGHGGVVIGSEISGGFRNLFVENCVMDSPNLERVIRIKTNTCRGGIIENIFVRDVTVGQCKEAVLKINLLYESNENCQRDFPPTVRNVHMQRVTSQQSRYGVLIAGLDKTDDYNVYDISVEDSSFDKVERGNSVAGATRVVFKNLLINGSPADTAEGSGSAVLNNWGEAQ
ncbi:MAG: glycoside hydrolase family 28 protein [Bacteroidales bacterium]|nr:glycoside hydrolase family 28 protein [Bacteroidales bacterium]